MDWNHLLTTYIIFLALFIGTKAGGGKKDNSKLLTTTPANGLTTNKCKDDPKNNHVARAKDCFDYFTLAIFWAPGYAYKQKLNNLKIRKNILPRWVIHGLWPTWRSGQENPACKRNTIYFSEYHLRNAKVDLPGPTTCNLHTALMNHWYTILDENSMRVTKNFWEHEFKQHGNCATRSSKIQNDVGYFRQTFLEYSKLDLSTTFSNENYKPRDTKNLSEIITIVNKKHNAKVKVDYTEQYIEKDNTFIAYLTELFFCFDHDLNAIDCTNLRHQEKNGHVMVTYPNSVPN